MVSVGRQRNNIEDFNKIDADATTARHELGNHSCGVMPKLSPQIIDWAKYTNVR